MKKITLLFTFLLIASLLLSSCSFDGFRKLINPPLESSGGDSAAPEIPTPDFSEKRLTFIGAGDNLIYYGNWRDAQSLATGDRKYDFSAHYANVKNMISSADIAFINQETLMSGDEPQAYPNFNSPRELAYDLCDVGFDVVNMANNHMLDMATKGLQSTIEFWKSMPVLMIGGYENAEDFNTIRILEKDGIKIAFLSFTYGTNGLKLATNSKIVVPYLDEESVKTQIASAKKQAELVFVSVHWGDENSFQPNDEQKRYAQLMADEGVDVIIGHHSHTMQAVEWIQGRDGNRTLCVYSLGNFIAEQARDINQLGGMITFDIVKVGQNKAKIENPIYVPTVIHFDMNFYHNQVCILEDYTDAMAKAHGLANYGSVLNRTKLIEYVKNVISQEFLPDYYRN